MFCEAVGNHQKYILDYTKLFTAIPLVSIVNIPIYSGSLNVVLCSVPANWVLHSKCGNNPKPHISLTLVR